MEIVHGKNSSITTLDYVEPGSAVFLQDIVWVVTKNYSPDDKIGLVDVSDGWFEYYDRDTEVLKVDATLHVGKREDRKQAKAETLAVEIVDDASGDLFGDKKKKKKV